MAILTAFVMLSVSVFVIADFSEESDAAAGDAGYMNVYINTGNGWSVETVLAANGCEAVKANSYYSWAGYVVGAYSALSNAPLVDGTLALIYEYS